MLRTLLGEVIIGVDRTEARADLTLRLHGGLITELVVDLPRSHPPPIRTDEDTVELLRRLAVHYPDAVIAGCHAEHLVAFSCKRRGFCPSCGVRGIAESAAQLVNEVVPEQSVRQWLLRFPYPLRFLFARRPGIMGQVLGIVYIVIATHLIKRAGFTRESARTGVVTLIQRFGSALNLNIHFHMLFMDGVYVVGVNGSVKRLRWR